MAGVARRHLQTAYAGLQKSLQQEWAFVQRFTLGVRMEFQAVEDELQYIFISALFQGATSQIPGRVITGLLVKQAGIALPKPTQTAGASWTASYVITRHLVAALCRTADFSLGDNALLMG